MLKKYWQKLNKDTIGSAKYWTIAVQNYSIYKDIEQLINRYISGRVLDIGAGNLAWKYIVKSAAKNYHSSDFCITHKNLDMIFDVTKSFPLKNNSYDSIFCHSVLEHTPEPWNAFDEFYRILKENGVLLISVPFIFYLHGAPDDYFRFTRYGMIKLSEKTGFKVCKLISSGGIAHFLINIVSIPLSTILYITRLHFAIRPVTKILTTAAALLDMILDPQRRFSMNIILVLKKVQ
ncbi:MAG: class I SAM-dependent methyltransferase [Chitinispirillaceae bacterium]|nr:class I SAM-dependent methyltransferase [Chitinispirillaceae bacterium]